MVKIRDTHFLAEKHAADPALLLELLSADRSADDLQRLEEAWQLTERGLVAGGRTQAESAAVLHSGADVATVLADLQLDLDSLLAGFLYAGVAQQAITAASVRQHFGDTVATLIDGVMRMDAVSFASLREEDDSAFERQHRQQETVRRMLVAMIDDVRVALIKIAERTQALRAVKDYPERQLPVAREVFDVYAPLAHRLGIGHLKWELEDLAFRYLQPEDYRRIAKLLDGRRIDRQQYIEAATSTLGDALSDVGIDAEVNGRAKHIYSIWRKMQRKRITFSEVYDVRAVRILVPTVRDCYSVLGIVHGMWRNIAQEFDDYIAIPKANGYRSLHTAVYGPGGKVIEIQIRTVAMHQEAELGVCSHWRYKGTDISSEARAYEDKVAWLRQVLDWHENLGIDAEQAGDLDWDVGQDRVYVFTPEGHVVDLPAGATPVDFAYSIHTEVGHRCRGAKVDGRIVPLAYKLGTGERVEIITGKQGSPSRDWLRGDLGFVCTARARTKIQAWFRRQARDENVDAGRILLEREFRRLALGNVNLGLIADKLGQGSVDDLLAAIGAGEMSAAQVLRNVRSPLQQSPKETLPVSRPQPSRREDDRFRVSGVGNLLSHIAGCCKPVPGDEIVGYVTVGRGVSVHRQDCRKILQLGQQEPDRIVAVDWGDDTPSLYPVDVVIEAYDRHGLLRDVTTLLGNERVNMLGISTSVDRRSNIAVTRMTLEVASLELLGRTLLKIDQITNVISARRVSE